MNAGRSIVRPIMHIATEADADTGAEVIHRMFTVKRVADLLGMTDRYVRLLIEQGKLPAYKIGRSVRIPEDGLVRFLEARRLPAK